MLDANTTGRLLASGNIDLLPKLFGTVAMTSEVQRELAAAGYAREWAENPPAWVVLQDPKTNDPAIDRYNQEATKHEEKGAGNVTRIDRGEASAISLAKEIAAETGHAALVLSEEGTVRTFLNAESSNQRVFATNLWSIACQADERGLINLAAERQNLERFCPLGSAEKHRDHVLEIDSPDPKIIQKTGFTPKEKVDLYQAFSEEHRQQVGQGRAKGREHEQDRSQQQQQTQDPGHEHGR